MTRRSPARLLAPLALVASVVAVLMIVSGSGDDETSRRPAPSTSTESAGATTGSDLGGEQTVGAQTGSGFEDDSGGRAAAPPQSSRSVHVVRAGDNLTTIAEQTGIPVARLLELNPDVDPQALVLGQRIKLRP